jgi:hypothetical protein
VIILHPPLGMLSNLRHAYRRHQPKGHQGERRRKNPSGNNNNNTPAGESRGLLKKTGNRGCALHQRPVTVVATTRGAPSPLRKNIPEKWNPLCAAKNLIRNFVKFPPDPLQSVSLKGYVQKIFTEIHCSMLLLLGALSKLPGMDNTAKPGRPVSEKKLSDAKKASTVAEDQIQELFNFWIQACRPTARRRPLLDSKRRLRLGAAIHDYGMETCRDAITGCTMSDFHMGRNKTNKKYDDVELIFRDAKHVEQFLDLFDKNSGEGTDW